MNNCSRGSPLIRSCAGRPFIRGTRIGLTVILDALTQGLSPEEVIDHYPSLETEDLHAALAYASWLAEKTAALPCSDEIGQPSISPAMT